MKIGKLSKTVWAVSLPIIFAEVSETLVDVTDAAFLARVGVTELAAVALADTIYEIFTVLTIGLIDGLQIMIARRVGQKRFTAVGDIFSQGLCLLAAVSVVLTLVLKSAVPYVAAVLFESEEISAAADAFLQIAAFGIIFHAVNLAYSALFVGLGRTRVLIGATLVLAVTNLALDYALIFGHFGLPQMGIRGAAVGSVGAEVAAFVFFTIYTLRYIDVRKYALFRFRGLTRRLTATLTGLSYPVALQALLEAARWFIFFLILEHLGEDVLARANIIYCCYALLLIPSEGFAETACSMVSAMIGGGSARRIGVLIRSVIWPTYLTTVPFLVLTLAAPWLPLWIFSDQPELIAGCVGGLRVVALTMLIVIPGQMWFAAVSGTGDTKAALLIEFALAVGMLACAYAAALPLGLPLVMIWVSLPVGWTLCLALSYAWVRSGRWRRLRI